MKNLLVIGTFILLGVTAHAENIKITDIPKKNGQTKVVINDITSNVKKSNITGNLKMENNVDGHIETITLDGRELEPVMLKKAGMKYATYEVVAEDYSKIKSERVVGTTIKGSGSHTTKWTGAPKTSRVIGL